MTSPSSSRPPSSVRRTHTGFSTQIERWQHAIVKKDGDTAREECIRLLNCETPELFRDSGYTHDDWAYHHTWKRHLPEPLVGLRVLQCVSPTVMWVVLVSTFCGIYATQLEPHGWPQITNHPSFVAPFTLASFALSLLLVFRTNSSYGRWWEARSAIGRMFNWPRIMVRLTIACVPQEQEHLVRAVGRWAAVLAAATFAYIMADGAYYQHTEDMLSPEELQWLKEREQPPFAVLQVISGLIKRASLDSWQRAQLEIALNEFDLLVGAAERISRQPIPLAYTRHTSRYMMIFLTFLPFAFWSLYKWVTIPIMAVFTFLLVGLENIGIQIEEPYSVLPLHQYSLGIKKVVLLTLATWKEAEEVVRGAAEPADTTWRRDSGSGQAGPGVANGCVGGQQEVRRDGVAVLELGPT